VAAEALVRWGTVPPGQFVPVAESSGLILELDAWVLRRACAQAAAWASAGQGAPRVAVNVSALHARDDRLIEVVEEVLSDTGLDPAALELEIAERALVRGFGELRTMLSRLVERGVHVTIDDFGTGHFSLGYLSSLPVTRVKIDTWFVTGIGADRKREAIAAATIGLGHGLGMLVTAEGIETREQLAFLRAAGCDEGQGYLLARPRWPAALDAAARLAPLDE
jgi:EAL domain-containing protein (putative c-di-GMP-specific phosphodiesterase class I)